MTKFAAPPNSDGRVHSFCPNCGASMYLHNVVIEWNDTEKEFTVSANGFCAKCGSPSSRTITSLPLKIAKESFCSCGGQMSLSDYKIKRSNGDIEFEGTFVCPVCKKSQNSRVSSIKRGLEEVWRKTKRVEIGPKGVVYEKESA